MGKFDDLDRYLIRRGHSWVYYRRVPTALAALDSRAPFIRHALGTRDLAIARRSRDVLAAADDELWAALTVDEHVDRSRSRYAAAIKRVKAMGSVIPRPKTWDARRVGMNSRADSKRLCPPQRLDRWNRRCWAQSLNRRTGSKTL